MAKRNEEVSPLSLKRKLFLKHLAVKVHKQKCVVDTISVKINSQNGSSSLTDPQTADCVLLRINSIPHRACVKIRC